MRRTLLTPLLLSLICMQSAAADESGCLFEKRQFEKEIAIPPPKQSVSVPFREADPLPGAPAPQKQHVAPLSCRKIHPFTPEPRQHALSLPGEKRPNHTTHSFSTTDLEFPKKIASFRQISILPWIVTKDISITPSTEEPDPTFTSSLPRSERARHTIPAAPYSVILPQCSAQCPPLTKSVSKQLPTLASITPEKTTIEQPFLTKPRRLRPVKQPINATAHIPKPAITSNKHPARETTPPCRASREIPYAIDVRTLYRMPFCLHPEQPQLPYRPTTQSIQKAQNSAHSGLPFPRIKAPIIAKCDQDAPLQDAAPSEETAHLAPCNPPSTPLCNSARHHIPLQTRPIPLTSCMHSDALSVPKASHIYQRGGSLISADIAQSYTAFYPVDSAIAATREHQSATIPHTAPTIQTRAPQQWRPHFSQASERHCSTIAGAFYPEKPAIKNQRGSYRIGTKQSPTISYTPVAALANLLSARSEDIRERFVLNRPAMALPPFQPTVHLSNTNKTPPLASLPPHVPSRRMLTACSASLPLPKAPRAHAPLASDLDTAKLHWKEERSPIQYVRSIAESIPHFLIPPSSIKQGRETIALSTDRTHPPLKECSAVRGAHEDSVHKISRDYRLVTYNLTRLPTPDDLTVDNYFHALEPEIQFLPRNDTSGYYFSVTLHPKLDVTFPKMRRNIVFFIDKTSALFKPRYEAYKQGVLKALKYLNEEDTFNVVVLDTKLHYFMEQSVIASRTNRRKARHFLDEMQSSFVKHAHVDLYDLLYELEGYFPKNGGKNTAILVTDGASLHAIETRPHSLQTIREKNQGKVTLHTAAATAKSNTPMLDILSTFHSGEFVFSHSLASLPRKIARLVKKTNAPIAHTIHVTPVSDDPLLDIAIYPENGYIPHFYLDKPFTVYGTVSELQEFTLVFQGKIGDRYMHYTQTFSPTAARRAHSSLYKTVAMHRAYNCYDLFLRKGDALYLQQANALLKRYNIPAATKQ